MKFRIFHLTLLLVVAGLQIAIYMRKPCLPCTKLHTTHEEQAQVRGIMNGLNAKIEKGKR